MNFKYYTCRHCSNQFPSDKMSKDNDIKRGFKFLCKNCSNTISKNNNNRIRLEVLNHYTNNNIHCQCVGCTETHIEFMTIDHMNNSGWEHRKSEPSAKYIYHWLRNNNYPSGFQVLCMNCNHSHGVRGYCPHNKEQTH